MDHPPTAHLLSANSKWAKDVEASMPEFFKESAKGQSPKILWIGCADSRVPESVVTGSKPGDIFVHRNIANQFHLDDDSAISVLTYAVDFVGVEHVVIVGHTECGGAAACFGAATSGSYSPGKPVTTIPSLPTNAPLNRWLAPMTHLAASLQLSSTPKSEALPILVEENVRVQVDNLCQSSIITKAWANKSAQGKDVYVHGWVYEIAEGKLRDLHISRGPRN